MDGEPAIGRHQLRCGALGEKALHGFPVRGSFARQRGLCLCVVEVAERTEHEPLVDVGRVNLANGTQTVDDAQAFFHQEHVEVEEVASRAAVEKRVKLGGEDSSQIERLIST